MPSEQSVQHSLARLAHAVQFSDLPDAVVEGAKLLILDALGCTLGGFHSEPAAVVRALARDLGGTAEASFIGSPLLGSCALAVFANGTALRYLDWNDYLFGRDPAHPSGNLPVALAIGERAGCSGREVIAALVGAYEIHLRLAEYAGVPSLWKRGWHHSCNLAFSASALAARLLGADAAVTAHAIAIAATHLNTLAQLQSGGISLIKATAEAWVAKGAVEAALLAQHGLTGPDPIMEGKAGWAGSVAGGVDLAGLAAPLDGDFRMMRTSVKPYAAVATAMAPVQAAIDLHRDEGVRADSIAAVVVRLPEFALGTPSADPDRRYPATRESADHSFIYCTGVALMFGRCMEPEFEDAVRTAPALRDLLGRIELAADAALTARWPGAAGGEVEVRLHDGRLLRRRYDAPPGHPTNMPDRAQAEDKFLSLAAPVLGDARARQALEAVWSLDQADSIAPLMQRLTTPA
ncbi:MAG: MmgE/PrpD family protein [Acetobacteraceae bacterium]